MKTIQGKGETGLLTPLFEAQLQYQSDMEAMVSAETQEGELVGSGDGRVSGDLLSGKARWSMYAGNCAYVFVRAGILPPPGQHLCTVHPAGVIETSDGAEVWFDAKGYGLRGADQSYPPSVGAHDGGAIYDHGRAVSVAEHHSGGCGL